MEKAFTKCRSVIASCKTVEHLKCAKKMIDQFLQLFDDVVKYSQLAYELDCKFVEIVPEEL